jgi:osmotically inducible protein OsmC
MGNPFRVRRVLRGIMTQRAPVGPVARRWMRPESGAGQSVAGHHDREPGSAWPSEVPPVRRIAGLVWDSVGHMPIRTASAQWQGTLTDGSGTVRTGQGGYVGNYSFKSRFEEGEGTNPEELIGAAHAGCFSMALSKALGDAGKPPTAIETTARVHLDKTDAGMAVTQIDLETVGDVPGIDQADFNTFAEGAKANCPISRLLSPGAKITLTARLSS